MMVCVPHLTGKGVGGIKEEVGDQASEMAELVSGSLTIHLDP